MPAPEAAVTSGTREAILDAVDVLLARYGYRKMTVDDVATEAGVGKGTIYLHFESKEELVLSHVDRIVDRVVGRMVEVAASRAAWPEQARRMLRERVLMRFDAVQHYRESLSELLASIRPALLARRKRHFAREAEVLSGALARGGFRAEVAAETAEAMLVATNALLPFSLSAKELGARAEIERSVERIAALLVKGAKRRGYRVEGKVKYTGRVLAGAVLAIAASVAASAQQGEAPFASATRDEVVKELAKSLRERYVFPVVGARAAQKIERQSAAGAYASLGRPELAEALTRDLQEVAHDKHLRVGARPPRPQGAVATPEQREAEQRRQMAHDNFGVQKIEILPGNVGYLDLRFFPPASAGGATAIAAMNLLGNASAVIVDLRHNGGGDPTQIQLISSYFFDKPTHLNSLYWREGDRTQQFWTLDYVPGQRMADTPVFVLTSGTTFSGGEEFANNLKMLKRGTIVGETTGGGANPGEGVDLPGDMSAFIPTGRAVNPVSGGNWEGTGVEPDVKVAAEDALKVAYGAALEKVAAAATRPEDKAQAEWYLTANRALLQPVALDAAALQPFAGRYGVRTVTLEGATLFYQREGRPKRRLTPLTKDTFAVVDLPEFRVRFVSEGGAPATKLVGLYDNGESDGDARTP